MKTRFVWIGVAVFLGLCAAALGAVLHPGFAVSELQDYVLRKTGRSLVVKGATKLVFTPELGVQLDDVSISNPQGMDGVFVTVGHVTLPLRSSDLFERKLSINKLSLTAAHFNFLIDGEGNANWAAHGKGDAPAQAKASSTPKEPLAIIIGNSTANYLDERSGQAFSVESATGQLGVGEDGEIDLAATVALNSQFAKIEAHLKSVARVTEDGSPADIAIRAPALDLNFSGRLGTRKALALVGTVDASSPDLRVLAKWLGNAMGGVTGLKNFKLNSAVDSSGTVFNLTKTSIGLDGMVANGALSADFSNRIPQISGALSTDLLTLDPYLAPPRKATPTVPAGDADWSVVPYKFSALNGVEGELAISAFLVTWRDAEWGPVEMTNRVKAGIFTARFKDAKLYDGQANATVTIDASQAKPSLKLDFDGQGLSGEKFLAKLVGVDWLTGATNVKAALSASGQNQQELMSSLQGTFNIAVSQGNIRGVDVLDSINSLGSAALAGWGGGDAKLTAFDSASASFAISDGIATTEDISIETPQLSVTGKGDVDMLRRAVDLKFSPQVSDAELPVHVAVKGPWGNPKINPDVAGVDVKKIEKKGKKILKKIFGN